MPEPTFAIMRSLHDQLDELFLLHQESLLAQDPGQALEHFDRFEAALREHIIFEEERLIPIYRRAGRIQGGPEEFFNGEHKRMLEMLGRCRTQLLAVSASAVGRQRGIIALFDLEAAFRSLSDHHHKREENLFFPTLDRVATAEEKRELVAGCFGYFEDGIR